MLSAPEKGHALPVVRYINYLLTYLLIDDGLTGIILCHAIHNYTGHNIMYDSVESLWSFN